MSTAWLSACSFRRYVAANVPEEVRRAQVRVLDPRPSEAGEQAQIDYGQLGRWLDPVTGKLHGVGVCHGLVLFAAHVRAAVLRMDQRAWTECHVAAFAFLTGFPPAWSGQPADRGGQAGPVRPEG